MQLDRTKLFEEMERQFESQNSQYFKNLLTHNDGIVRTRAVCILADMAAENAVKPIGDVLKRDNNGLFAWPAGLYKRDSGAG